MGNINTTDPYKNYTSKEAVDKSLRYNDGKPQWSLVHLKSLEPLVRVLEYGAKKYERDNWKKGLDPQEILDSIIRHIAELQSGEDRDKESGELHIGHIMANCMFYVYHKYVKNDGDKGDRISE